LLTVVMIEGLKQLLGSGGWGKGVTTNEGLLGFRRTKRGEGGVRRNVAEKAFCANRKREWVGKKSITVTGKGRKEDLPEDPRPKIQNNYQ